MSNYDCFNGDADGICALTQLRLAQPCQSTLVTGVKRDIKLLDRVQPVAGDQITALDISFDKNRASVERILEAGASIFYCDHHFAGDDVTHPQLETLISPAADVCTSLLINKYLDGQFLEWAVVGTFGDNLERSATVLAKGLDAAATDLERLQNLGIYINYNGYGAALEDLYFDPAELYQRTSAHSTATAFINEDAETFEVLEQGYLQDMAKAAGSKPSFVSETTEVYQLPNAAWARRVSGVFGNDLANQAPSKAHAVLTEKADGNWLVSVRAPLENKRGADEICRQFETGGGRAAAAGINSLPATEIDKFVRIMQDFYTA